MKKTLRILLAAAVLSTGGAIAIVSHNAGTPAAAAHHFTQVGGHWSGHTPPPVPPTSTAAATPTPAGRGSGSHIRP